MRYKIIEGDLLAQDVDVIVNSWNRNIIPWWMLLPQGVSGAIKKHGGYTPFREVAKYGPIPLGEAVLTGAGRLKFKGIIHVAGINIFWRATEDSIRSSVRSAVKIVEEQGFKSIAFPLIGAGVGSFSPGSALRIMCDELKSIKSDARASIVILFSGVKEEKAGFCVPLGQSEGCIQENSQGIG
jgi:O-acetyl-ADP-ribose deacetylase (regulator of RNase III)